MRRYPVAPLLEATGLSMSALARRVGVGGGEYARVRSEGVSELAADRWANRLGLHPTEVWHDFGFAVCAADGCEATFAPRNSRNLYCSPRCRNTQKQRRYRATPHGAATNRRHRMAWYWECREYERKMQRARRARRREAA